MTEEHGQAYEMQDFGIGPASEVPLENQDPKNAHGSETQIAATEDEQKEQRQLQKWNAPASNMWRTFAAFYSFLVLGLAASSFGVGHAYANGSCHND